jgi:hypothetical protein
MNLDDIIQAYTAQYEPCVHSHLSEEEFTGIINAEWKRYQVCEPSNNIHDYDQTKLIDSESTRQEEKLIDKANELIQNQELDPTKPTLGLLHPFFPLLDIEKFSEKQSKQVAKYFNNIFSLINNPKLNTVLFDTPQSTLVAGIHLQNKKFIDKIILTQPYTGHLLYKENKEEALECNMVAGSYNFVCLADFLNIYRLKEKPVIVVKDATLNSAEEYTDLKPRQIYIRNWSKEGLTKYVFPNQFVIPTSHLEKSLNK